MKKIISLVMALFVLVTACGIAIVWAWERGTSSTEKILLTAIAVVVVLAVHILPALIKRPVVWALWTVCLCVAIYSHAGFFSMVTMRAAEARGQQSAQRQAVQTQIEEIKATLATIKARPVAQVSTILSYTKDPARIDALSLELVEAQRAAKLRDELVVLSATQTNNLSIADAVTDLVTRVSGLSIEAVTLTVNLITALLLELIGVTLWLEVLSSKADKNKSENQSPHQSDPPRQGNAALPMTSVQTPSALLSVQPTSAPQNLASQTLSAVVHPAPLPAPTPAATTVTTEVNDKPLVKTARREEVSMVEESVTIRDIDYTNSEIEVRLMQAMISGECPATVSGIRAYLHCSQSVAVTIQRNMADWIQSLDLAVAHE